MNLMRTIIAAVAVVLLCGSTSTAGTDSPITYQGYLTDGGQPAQGTYDIVVRIFGQATGGTQLFLGSVHNDTPVVNGIFTVDLDFPAGIYTNEQRWLQLEVNGNVLSPRQPIRRTPYAIQTRGIYVDDNMYVGIGTLDPVKPLHVVGAIQSNGLGAGMIVRNPGNDLASVSLGWLDDVARIRIGGNGPGADAGLDIQSIGNASLMRILHNGNVGIGTTSPNANLAVVGDGGQTTVRISNGGGGSQTNTGLIVGDVVGEGRAASLYGITTSELLKVQNDGSGPAAEFVGEVTVDSSTGFAALRAESTSISGFGVYGKGVAAGVYGAADPGPGATYGVFASGNLGASGTKSFVIDHPVHPAYKYLIHYCAEAPEPLNVYSGTAMLDARGEAWVDLPDYFELINRDIRYQLTCIGGYANVYIAREVEDNRFRIAGGRPGLKVSWEVKGVRNDAWVRAHGAPDVIDKPAHLQGRYLQPELLGLSERYAEYPVHAQPTGRHGSSSRIADDTHEQETNVGGRAQQGTVR